MIGTEQRANTGSPEVVALMGSYRKGGTIDTVIDELLEGAREGGARTHKIALVDEHVEFCRNCRSCCREPGSGHGECVIDDDAGRLFDELERADAIVLGAPVNLGDVNALTRRLLERMICYTYWPVGAPGPKLRHEGARKPAVLVSSSAAPAIMTRLFARPLRTLKQMATFLGARPVARLVVGLSAGKTPRPGEKTRRAARRLGKALAGER